jgi:hypothetical protein
LMLLSVNGTAKSYGVIPQRWRKPAVPFGWKAEPVGHGLSGDGRSY